MLKRNSNGHQELTWPTNREDFWELTDRWGLDPQLSLAILALGFYSRQIYGINLWIMSGRRSQAEQLRLQAQQPSRYSNPQVASSHHLSGQAADLSSEFQLNSHQWQAVGELGEALGLRWGGRFRVPDRNHFDLG